MTTDNSKLVKVRTSITVSPDLFSMAKGRISDGEYASFSAVVEDALLALFGITRGAPQAEEGGASDA